MKFPSHPIFESAISILRSIGLPLHHSLPSNPPSAETASIRPDSSQSRPTSTAHEQLISSQETLSVARSPDLPPRRIESREAYAVAPVSSVLPSPAFFRTSCGLSMPPPDYRQRSAGTIPSTNQSKAANIQDPSLQEPEALPRPSTTPGSLPQMQDSLSQVLPPRRVLPFDLPVNRSKDVSVDNEGQQPQDAPSVSEPAATKTTTTRGRKPGPKAKPKAKAVEKPKGSPKVKPAKAAKARNGKKADYSSQTPLETISSERLDSRAENEQMVDAPGATPAPHPTDSAAQASSSGTGAVDVSTTSRKRPSVEMEDGPADEQEPLSAVCPSCQHLLPQPDSHDEPSREKMPDPQANPSRNGAPTAAMVQGVSPTHLDRIESVTSPGATRPLPEATNSLAGYAAQSDEDRLAALDTFICQKLMDDDFLKLCEDVERSWRRIGLEPSPAGGGSRISQRISQISRFADAALFENLCRD